MLGVKVKDTQGRTWRVTRRWVPWRRRLKGAVELLPDLPSGDDPVSAAISVIMLILFLPVILLVLLSGVELLLVLLIVPFAALARVLFGRQWTIEARRGWTPWWEARAGDWRQSGQAIRDVAAAIGKGVLPPPNIRDEALPRVGGRRPVEDPARDGAEP